MTSGLGHNWILLYSSFVFISSPSHCLPANVSHMRFSLQLGRPTVQALSDCPRPFPHGSSSPSSACVFQALLWSGSHRMNSGEEVFYSQTRLSTPGRPQLSSFILVLTDSATPGGSNVSLFSEVNQRPRLMPRKPMMVCDKSVAVRLR